jgi:hypothetical protein
LADLIFRGKTGRGKSKGKEDMQRENRNYQDKMYSMW